MQLNLSSAISSAIAQSSQLELLEMPMLELEPTLGPKASKSSRLKSTSMQIAAPAPAPAAPVTAQPVLQLSAIPQEINLDDFKNPHTPTNPNGDYISLYRFRQLANEIPSFAKFYYPSSFTIEDVYGNILNGATITPNSSFTSMSFYNAKKKFSSSTLSGLAGIPEDWRPAYASPDDWYDISKYGDSFIEVCINPSCPSEGFNNNFYIIQENSGNQLCWNYAAGNEVSTSNLTSDTKITSISFKLMLVQVIRPWLDLSILQMNGWYLDNEPIGFISSGDYGNNGGIFPLYLSTMIVGTDLQVQGNLSKTDNQLVSNMLTNNLPLGLNNLLVKTLEKTADGADLLTNSGYFIAGWISSLVGQSPKMQQT